MAGPYTPFGYTIPGFNPRLPSMQTPDTLTGLEAATPPPSQLGLGDSLRSVALGFVNPLGIASPPPMIVDQSAGQTLTGQELPPQPRVVDFSDFQAKDRTGQALGSVLGINPAFGIAGRVAQSPPAQALARALAKPLIGAPAAVGGATYATTGQTAESGAAAMGQIDTDIGKIRARQEKQQAEVDRLTAEAERFRTLKSSDKNAVREAQQYLKNEKLYAGNVDGSWGDKTQAAVESLLERNREQLAAAKASMKGIAQEIEPLSARRRTLEQSAAEEAAEQSMPTWRKLVRDYAGLAGMVAGPMAPTFWRAVTRKSTETAERTAAAEADALINPAAAVPERVSGVNQFYRRGGSAEPFEVAPNAPLGFAPSLTQPSAATLYPPANAWMRPADWARTGTFAASGLASEAGKHYAQDQLDQARADFKQSPTEANARRVANWEITHAAFTAGARFNESAALTYPGIAGVQRYRSTAPNTAAAGAEVMRLNDLLRNRPIDPLEVTRRRRTPGFEVAPGSPLAPGEVERMVSPAGQKMLIRQPNGRWRDEQGRPGTPRAGWRRISAVETSGDVG